MALKGFKQNKEHIEKRVATRKTKGSYFMSEKNRIAQGDRLRGKKRPEGFGEKISEIRKGYKISEETKKKIGNSNRGKKHPQRCGENHHNWKGGISTESEKIRKSLEYTLWRESVFKRDNYTCIWCGIKSGNRKAVVLNADHIKPFSLYPELRFAIDNGRTLCIDCHRKTETYGRCFMYKQCKK